MCANFVSKKIVIHPNRILEVPWLDDYLTAGYVYAGFEDIVQTSAGHSKLMDGSQKFSHREFCQLEL